MEQTSFTFDLAEVVVEDHCRLSLRSKPECIASAVDFLVQRATQCGAVHASRTNRLLIALHEALTNSVIHGNLGVSSELKERSDDAFAEAVAARSTDPEYGSRIVDVQARCDSEAASWVFTDQGEGFDVARALDRLENEAPDPWRPSGRGLFLMRAFVDEMRYEDRGRRLTLTLHRSSGTEKRSQPRIPIAREVRVAPIDADGQVRHEAGCEAVARDISAHGIGFFQSHLAQSTRVMITIPTAGEPISLPAKVCHYQQVGDQVEVGCRFESPDSSVAAEVGGADPATDSLGKLVDRLAEQGKPLAEKRTAPRLPYTESVSVEPADGPPLRGFARDLSRSGISFFTTASLPLSVVRLSLPAGQDVPGVTLRAQVVRCTRVMDGFFDVAARFLPG